jgi:aminoglycoside 6'-N-acetyltransferase I
MTRRSAMKIIDLFESGEETVQAAAEILVLAFQDLPRPAWPDLPTALEEVDEFLTPSRIARVCLNDTGEPVGWIGGISQYSGRVWELHPLAVLPGWQKKGIGRLLAADFEEQVRRRGSITITLGTDDENEGTSLSGVDLYPDVWGHIRRIKNLKGHPYEFYLKIGFVITGVVPDANGIGKPDILMSKRVG